MRSLVSNGVLLLGLAVAAGCQTASRPLSGPGLAASAIEPLAGPDLAGKTTVVLDVRGMSCRVCATAVSRQLKGLVGVEATQADPATGQVTVTLAPGHRLTAAGLIRAVEDAGYTLDRVTPAATAPGKP